MNDIETYKVSLEDAIHGMKETAERIEKDFSGLNANQINWKPNEDSWSVGQCLEHLIITHSRYLGCFADLAEGKSMNFWQKVSPISGMMGNAILKSVIPDNLKKQKTFPVFEPSQSDIRPDIVEEYRHHLNLFLQSQQKLKNLDDRKTMISSPVNKWITYSLRDAFSILYQHDKRHVNQALYVMKHDSFPKK